MLCRKSALLLKIQSCVRHWIVRPLFWLWALLVTVVALVIHFFPPCDPSPNTRYEVVYDPQPLDVSAS